MKNVSRKGKPMDKAKEFLSRAFLLKRLIASKNELIERLRAQAESASVALSPTKSAPTNKRSDIIGDSAAQIVDLCAEVLTAYNDLLTAQREIIEVIERVTQDNLRLVLEQRYLCDKKWENIAIDNAYDYSYVHELHRNALIIVLDLIKKSRRKKTPHFPTMNRDKIVL